MKFSESAISKLQSVLGPDEHFVRVFVSGGGCSGFEFGFMLEKEKAEDDLEFPFGNCTVLVDSLSFAYLDHAEFDYVEKDFSGQFTIKGAEIKTCGCGSSFTTPEI